MSVLRQLERRYAAKQQAPAAVPAGTSLNAIIEAMVDARIAERMQQKPRSPRLRRILDNFDRKPQVERWTPAGEDFDNLPAPVADRQWIAPEERQPVAAPSQPQAPTVRVLERDGNNQIRTIQLGDLTYRVSRDGAGHLAAMTSVES